MAKRVPGKDDADAPADERYDARTINLDEGRVDFPDQRGARVSAGETVERTEISMEGPTCAADVMTEGVKTASADTDLATVAAIMRDEKIGIVPIVDADRRVVGVITDRDIVVRVDAEAAPVELVRAGDVMTKDVVTVRPDDDLLDVIDRMGEAGLHRVLVADDDAHILGIISISDLARRTDLPERVQDTLDQIARHRY